MDIRDFPNVLLYRQWAEKFVLGPLYDPEPSQESATRLAPFSTPPASSRHSRRRSTPSQRKTVVVEDDEKRQLPRRQLSRGNSVKNKLLAPSPPRPQSVPLSGLERRRSVPTTNSLRTRWNQGTILFRADSVSISSPGADRMAVVAGQNHSRASSLADRTASGPHTKENRGRGGSGTPPRRTCSLRERYPGDMSHRPLAILMREHRAADRAPHLHNYSRQQPCDTIDALDLTGPGPSVTYHHSGPFDPTMKERNANKKYAPIEAVRDTNMMALKATPAEFVQDSLEKHVPLQGTAVVPPGMKDLSGRTMEYEEGADLMREEDAAGGPYKRWEHISYRDGDLKGKGEPSFSIDLARREQRTRSRQAAAPPRGGAIHYKTQPSYSSSPCDYGGTHSRKEAGSFHVLQRIVSNGDELHPGMDEKGPGSSGLRGSNTTGKSLTQSLKRRLGSLGKKRSPDEARY